MAAWLVDKKDEKKAVYLVEKWVDGKADQWVEQMVEKSVVASVVSWVDQWVG